MAPTHPFVEDLTSHGQYHCVIIRSPIAAGRLLGIDVPRLPHAYALITAKDIPGKNSMDGFTGTHPILVEDTIHYFGEPVALLVGPDLSHLEQFSAVCVVRTKEDKPLYSSEKFSSDRLAAKRTLVLGDPEKNFKKPALLMEGTYHIGPQEHWYPEPHGAYAVFSYDKMVITLPTQWPFQVRRVVASVLNVAAEDIVIRPSELGLHLDGKLWYPALMASYAALTALICKKPVKLLLTREEDVCYTPKRPSSTVKLRTALGSQGEIVALETHTVMDVGAGGPFSKELLDRNCLGSLGPYRCPNLRMEGFAVLTNKVPAGPFAGLGLSQAAFSIERHVSRIADTLGQDPAEWRLNNIINKGDKLASGDLIRETVPSSELIDTVCSMSDYKRKWAAYETLRRTRRDAKNNKDGFFRGIGLSFSYQGNGFFSSGADRGNYAVELTLSKDSILEIRTSAVVSSEELHGIWKNIAAEALSLDVESIIITENSTDVVPDSGPSSLSRNITIISKLIERCCNAIRKQRFRDPLPITVRRAYRPPGGPLMQLSWGAAVVEIEIDAMDYKPRIRGVWLVVDGGRILSESRARSALKLSSIHALSWASREYLDYDQGRISSEAAFVYDIPSSCDLPAIEIDFYWTDSTSPKGIGELPFATIPAAYAQAIAQGVDYPFASLPISAEAIRNAMEGEADTP